MLELNIFLQDNPANLCPPECQITKVIELPTKEFNALVRTPQEHYDFIDDNHEHMGNWGDTTHCLLVLQQGERDGVLISSASGSVDSGAYFPDAREFVKRELEQLAALLLEDITPESESGDISIYLEDIEELTGAVAADGSDVAAMFLDVLHERSDVGNVTLINDECMVVTPSPKPEAKRELGDIRLLDVILLGNMENAYLIHNTADLGFVPASYLPKLNDKGQEEYLELLYASVDEIRPGAYGPEIVLSCVDPDLIVKYEQAAADYKRAEFRMGDPTM